MLADRIRPKTLSHVVGQQHLLSEGKILNRIISSGNITNMIFFGPSGTGKTTVARIAAGVCSKKFYALNATNASLSDIKAIVGELGTLHTLNGALLYLDEIQNFNKKQQQSLLEFIETGSITLIASTTENPYFYIYNAILSRCNVFEFKHLTADDIITALTRALDLIEVSCSEQALRHIAESAGGDLRKALNWLELASCYQSSITLETAVECTQKKAFNYDKFGDNHYDILSAFQKSIRGSDVDASLHYLARLIMAGDLFSICRRLLVIAAEDIGLAYPSAVSIVKACVDSAVQLGFPECRIPLAQAVILLAASPKSNSVICAIDAAMRDVETKDTGDIPLHIKDTHSGGGKSGKGLYKYPHNYKNNYIAQQYLPDSLKGAVYYTAGQNKTEQQLATYQKQIRNTGE